MNGRSSRGSESNIYSRFFGDETSELEVAPHRKVIGLFTSSQDEFAALGPEWHIQDWTDQWIAFDHVLNTLEPSGFAFYLRIHPNFTTKSHASFVRESGQIEELLRKHPNIRVIWHDEQVNSYSLIASTDVVVVWDSTIGLEASGRGVPVWELAASYYDLYTDIRQWFRSEDAPASEALEYVVDQAKAWRFMAYLALRDSPLPAEALAIRNSLLPKNGAGTRLAQLLSSGGAPGPAVAVSSIIDTVRHRNGMINSLALSRFLSRPNN
jgi:hypothetical protein